MDQSSRLPAGLRMLLEQALALADELRGSEQTDEEVRMQQMDDLRLRVSDALGEVRTTDHPRKREITRALKVADGILLHLTDPTQRDARGRLRDISAHLREALG